MADRIPPPEDRRRAARDAGGGVDRVRGAAESARGLRFQPGQHLTLRTERNGEEIRRSYSICTGLDDGELRVAVKKVEGGAFSTLCNELIKPGDAIDVMTPQGRFGVAPDPAAARNYLAIAAGSGITPVLSLLRSDADARAAQPLRADLRQPHHAGHHLQGSAGGPEGPLSSIASSCITCCRASSRISHLFNGRIDGEKIGTLLKSFAAAVRDRSRLPVRSRRADRGRQGALTRLGVPAERIHVEYFSTDGVPVAPRRCVRQAERTVSRPIAIAQSRFTARPTTCRCREGETIIDAGLRAGLEMPYLLPRRHVLHLPRQARVRRSADGHSTIRSSRGRCRPAIVLTCQSHPLTPEVTVDYDTV